MLTFLSNDYPFWINVLNTTLIVMFLRTVVDLIMLSVDNTIKLREEFPDQAENI